MSRGRSYGFSFSWKRAIGLSAAKGKLSRQIGIPLTKSGRQRKAGRAMGCGMIIAAAGLAALVSVAEAKKPKKPPEPHWQGWNTLSLAAVEKQPVGGDLQRVAAGSDNYGDELIAIAWKPDSKMLHFIVENLAESTLALQWDEAAFVGLEGTADRVIHTGVKYMDTGKSLPPTIVPRGTKHSDAVIPASNIHWSEGSRFVPGQWTIRPLLALFILEGKTEAEVAAALAPDGTMRVLLPIVAGDRKVEYTFVFQVGRVVKGPEPSPAPSP